MSAGPSLNPDASALPPPDETAPEGSQRLSNAARWSSGGWPLLVLVILYPVSIVPAYVALLVLRRRGIDLSPAYDVFYWPVLWVLQNVPLFRQINDVIEPALRGLVK
jgi:hypothetical protein